MYMHIYTHKPTHTHTHTHTCSALSQDATPLSYVAAAEDKRFFQQRTPGMRT